MNTPSSDSEGFDVNNLSPQLLEVVLREQAEKKDLANKALVKVHNASDSDNGIIAKFNAKYPIEQALRLSGKYTKQSDGKWLYKDSTSGIAGGHITENGKFYTFHQSDPFCDGFSHDSFDIYCFYAHGGNFGKAIQAAANEIDPEGQKQRRLEHIKGQQAIVTPSSFQQTPSESNFGSLFVDGNALLSVKSKIEYIIHDIIESNTMGLIFGPSGEAKSFNADAMACCCATGFPWAGHATKKGLVIYLNGEGFFGKSRRIQAWSIKNNNNDLANFVLSKQTVNFETDIQPVIDEINNIVAEKELSPTLVIVDTLARHLFGDENSSKDVMKFLSKVEFLRSQYAGCSVLIVHHTGNDSENLHRARGSSALKAAMDFEIQCNKGLLTFTKMKDSELPKPIEFKLVPVEIGIDEESGETITSCVVEYGERSERNKGTVLTEIEKLAIKAAIDTSTMEANFLNSKYVTNTKTWRECFYRLRKAEDSEIKPDTLKKAFKRIIISLTDKGVIEQVNTDSVLVGNNHQAEIHGAILARNFTPIGTRDMNGTTGDNVPGIGNGTTGHTPLGVSQMSPYESCPDPYDFKQIFQTE